MINNTVGNAEIEYAKDKGDSIRSITQYLIKVKGFSKMREAGDGDIDLFTCYKRIHEIHYLFFSETHKAFTLAVKYDQPKGKAGGGFDEFKKVMIPKVIYSFKDACKLLEGIEP